MRKLCRIEKGERKGPSNEWGSRSIKSISYFQDLFFSPPACSLLPSYQSSLFTSFTFHYNHYLLFTPFTIHTFHYSLFTIHYNLRYSHLSLSSCPPFGWETSCLIFLYWEGIGDVWVLTMSSEIAIMKTSAVRLIMCKEFLVEWDSTRTLTCSDEYVSKIGSRWHEATRLKVQTAHVDVKHHTR